MKSIFYTGRFMSANKFLCSLFSVFCLTTISSQAQTYLSNHLTPILGTTYQSSKPSGTLCILPDFANAGNVADGDLDNYASVSGTVGVSLICNSVNAYSIRSKISFPSGTTFAPSGYYAGFRLQLSSVLSVTLLQSSITLRTYLNGAPAETQPGAGILNLSLLRTITEPSNISFVTTAPFDEVEVIINTSVLGLNAAFNYQFFYAYASQGIILPVKLASFSAAAEGKNVKLNWASATEQNTATYELERSSDGGRSFATIGSVAAKGNSNSETKYSFTDGSVVSAEYLYRLKVIDKDGVYEHSKTVSIKFGSAVNWKVYPTMLSSGASINVSIANSSAGKSELRLSNLQGQTVGVYTTTDSKLTIPTSNLPVGMYVLKLYRNGQATGSEKVVIQ